MMSRVHAILIVSPQSSLERGGALAPALAQWSDSQSTWNQSLTGFASGEKD